MSRLLRISVLLLLLASCGHRYSAPSDIDNACAIARERPAFLNAMQRSQGRWGVPVNVQMAFIHQESRFRRRAKTPYRFALGVIPMGRQSSAYGYAQVLDSTWREYERDTGRYWARRDRINDAADFMGWYLDKAHERLGISRRDARALYLAYHEGFAGYARGTYRSKPWLLRVANRVDERSERYRRQLQSCGIY